MVNIDIKVDVGDIKDNPASKMRKLEEELYKYLANDLSKDIEKEYEATIENWSSAPEFKSTMLEPSGAIILQVAPYGRGKQKWRWVSEGTRKRVITAKSPNKMMRFPRNYAPKTVRYGPYGGSGAKTGPIVLAKRVTHQIKPRLFSLQIVRNVTPSIRRDVTRIVRRTLT